MERHDVRPVTELLQKHLRRFQLAPSMGEEEVAHWFLPQDNIIDTYVVEVWTETWVLGSPVNSVTSHLPLIYRAEGAPVIQWRPVY